MYVEFPGIDLLHRLSESVELLDIGFVAIALQRMLQGAKCTANHCVKLLIPAFAAE